MRHEYFFLLNICVSSSVFLLTFLPSSAFPFYEPHTRFLLKVHMKNTKVIFRTSLFPCVLLGTSRYTVLFELSPFRLRDINNKSICLESCVLCTAARKMISCLSVCHCFPILVIFYSKLQLKNVCYQFISSKVSTLKLEMHVKRNTRSSDGK